MSVEVRTAEGVVALNVDGIFRLEEAATYHIEMPTGTHTPLAWLGPRELPWHEERRIFTLEIGHWVGSAQLRIVQGAHEMTIPVEVGPRPEKLSEGAWLALLNDLEAWSPGSSVGFEGGGMGTVKNEGTTAPILASALLPLVPALVRAVRTIAVAPRELTESVRDDTPLRTVRRADREMLHWLTRHPRAAHGLNPWSAERSGTHDSFVPHRTAQNTVDHPVNRYVAWLIRRVAGILCELAEALNRKGKNPQLAPDTGQWCRDRSRAAAIGADELSHVVSQTLFGKLAPQPLSEAVSLALQDDPLYSRAHALARPFLSPRFQLRESIDGNDAPVKPSFELYELWTLLAVQQSFAKVLAGWKWNWHPTPGSELLAGFGNGSFFAARRDDGAKVDIHYNLTFPGYLARGKSDRYSISGERRPDIVISFELPGTPRSWIFLDAKYRVRREALADAFTSLHVYRDSLQWERFGGSCRGGLLLVPAEDAACEQWFRPEFRERFGLGVFRLTPGDVVDGVLARVIAALFQDPAIRTVL